MAEKEIYGEIYIWKSLVDSVGTVKGADTALAKTDGPEELPYSERLLRYYEKCLSDAKKDLFSKNSAIYSFEEWKKTMRFKHGWKITYFLPQDVFEGCPPKKAIGGFGN
ncbi:Uncharacterised protein [uncultured archaeon]|nr:Uncharacterised protein [uncultured archaeon]